MSLTRELEVGVVWLQKCGRREGGVLARKSQTKWRQRNLNELIGKSRGASQKMGADLFALLRARNEILFHLKRMIEIPERVLQLADKGVRFARSFGTNPVNFFI